MALSKKILVVGGTGRLGLPVVNQLRVAGFEVRVLSRHPSHAARKLPADVETVYGNVEDRSSLIEPMKGCSGIHINLNGAAQKRRYFEIEYEGTQNIARVAESAGVKHITMISGSTVDEHRPENFVRAKAQAEKVLIDSNINATILRASAFMETIPQMIRGPFGVVLGKQPYPFYVVAADEFAEKVAKIHKDSIKYANKILQAYGPEQIYLKDALKAYVRTKAKGKLILQLPLFFMWLPSKFMGSEITHIYHLTKHFEEVPEPERDGISDDLLEPFTTTLEDWLS